ncbi:LysR substrate-binding domain-containing protein [Methylobacterium isbiliense]|uniref:HTH-type transcriptional regulator HdfR n=1 Tax=Methylobacterium isbiliense TaxID=315478 RepID=A0ABQ4SBU5_9HYPH|nr:LysR substrate-binding domain-containing protein [Methylobacterium isbiliense]MDN3626625.1 LysR substrate-binding domain-containing protein [Methylobacterium isbiliense]GJD99273.1 HTH-type transcriptional regulator HdfR [Methylobacterium isbiliense]
MMPPSFDLDVLFTFVSVVENGSFTRAAKRIGRSQPAVSQQIKRLEDSLGRRIFERDTNEVRLTPHGEILLKYAQQIIKLSNDACLHLTDADVAGVVRIGTPEDFATTHLSAILSQFVRAHPLVALEVYCDFTVNLLDGFSKGLYDLMLFKREPQGFGGGTEVWREVLDWTASPNALLPENKPIPLVLAPVPDVYRKRALAALDAEQRPWRIAYTSPSLAGLQAAVQAGLGITVLPTEMIPAGLVSVTSRLSLPKLADTEIALYRAPGTLSQAAELLASSIIESLGKFRSEPPLS